MTAPSHGTPARYGRGCHCPACTNAVRLAEGRRRLLRESGRWEPFTDPRPAREHVAALLAAGLTRGNIAQAAGIPLPTLDHLRRGDYRTVRAQISRAILAIDPARARPDRYLVDATGTRRRVQALYWRGFTTAAMNAQTGIEASYLRALARGVPLVTRDTRAVVAALYRRWHDQDPCPHGVDGAAAARARAFARRRGFAPPGAWTDIDDPAEAPDLGERTRRPLAVAEDVEFIRRTTGVCDRDVIAARLGVARDTLDRNLERAKHLRVRDREPVAA